MRKAFFIALSLFALLGNTVPAHASTITVSYTGVVTAVDAALQPTLQVGNLVSGSFTFDNTPVAPDLSGATWADYFGALTSFTLTVGSYTATATGGSVFVGDDYQAGSAAPLRDTLVVTGTTGLSGASIGGLGLARLQYSLLSANLGVLTDLGLPDAAELAAMWANNEAAGNVNFLQFSGSTEARYSLASFSVTAVPEPATLLLLGAGLGAVAARRRLKKRV